MSLLEVDSLIVILSFVAAWVILKLVYTNGGKD